MKPKHLHSLLSSLFLGLALTASGQDKLLISEFMAVGGGPILDQDGDPSNWIEIYNAGTNTVNLAGWYLTDDPAILTNWAFPAITLDPDRFLVVFASGKDRRVASRELHTKFQLNRAGEYLALVKPNGQTIVHQFAPAYPPQVEDVSYGIEIRTALSPFITNGTMASWRVPAGPADMPTNWTATNFDHRAWTTGRTGLGFDITNGPAPGTATNLARGQPTTQSSTLSGYPADAAVNGNLADFTHTQAGQNLPATWEVNLGTNYALERIVLYNRTSCCGSRLRDITVRVLSADGTTTNFTSQLLNPENVLGGQSLNGPASLTLDLTNLTVIGGRVRVTRTPDPDRSGTLGQGNNDEMDVLSLGEVEVFGGGGSPLLPLIRTDIGTAMRGSNASVLVRLPFVIPVEEMPVLDILTLRMKYDDGFVAYLNGVEVASRNDPAMLAWNSTATAAQPTAAAAQFEDIDLTPFIGLLQEGENVLAIQGLNVSAADGDFLLLPELIGKGIGVAAESYFAQPTPRGTNAASFLDFVTDTKFSVDRGFYSRSFTVAITNSTPGAEIRYTTNGSAPSAVNGLLYTGPITISGTTVLRAIATKPGYKPSNVDTHTYVFLSNVVAQSSQSALNAGFPSTWTSYPSADYAMDTRITGPNATQMVATLRSLPSLFITTSVSNLFDANTGIYTHPTSSGVAWERPASLELLTTNGATEFQADCGLRIQGGYFRQASVTHKHSFRVLFREEYGMGRLHHELFPEADAVKEFDTLVLRAGANDGYAWSAAKDTEQFTRDEFGRHLQLDMGHPAPHGIFVHLYLNGLYWGLYNLIERPNEDFSSSYFGGEPEEWDANNAGEIKAGDLQAWNTFIGLVQQSTALTNYQRLLGNNPDSSRNPAYPVYLDKWNYIDYMIVNIWGGNWDWPNKNFWFGRRRTADSTGFKFYTWDFENTMGNDRNRSPTNMVAPRSGIENSWVGSPHYYLKNYPEYRIDFADRVHRYFFNGGLLTPPVLTNRYRLLANTVQAAIISESARWGDDNLDPPQDQADWLRERDWILGTYLPVRSGIVLQQFRSAGLYPSLSAPVFSQHGGGITNGFALTMYNSNAVGTIYYTLDGTDPRLSGGAVSSNALIYSNAVVIGSMRVKARVLSSGNWSALNEADFALPDLPALRITELMFHPAPVTAVEFAAGFTNAEDFEYIELRNVGSTTLSLAGINFDKGITFTFSSGTLTAGGRIVLVKNIAAFTYRYGTTAVVVGPYDGNLNNGGERLRLLDAAGRTIQDFNYSDGWYSASDGFGFSLVIRADNAPPFAWDDKASWQASSALGGSPGLVNPVPPSFPPVVINELLSRPAPPDKVAIELANLGDQPADVSNWWLTDDYRTPKKFQLPTNTIIAGGGFAVFTEDDFNTLALGTNALTFSPSGDEVFLFSANANGELTGYCQGWDFSVAEEGVSFGRYVTSPGTDHFLRQQRATLGDTNAGPRVGPIVIGELMYHPPDVGATDNSRDEYLELRNISTNAVSLGADTLDTSWQLMGGIDFVFPTNLTMAPDEYLLVVNFDPVADPGALANFRQLYKVPETIKILGPYGRKLNNDSDNVELKKPTLFTTGIAGYVLVDKVSYQDSAPWPKGADGFGLSLQRRNILEYGNDVTNWVAALPTAAALAVAGEAPVITLQPTNQTALAFSTAAFTVGASGPGPLNYQWQFNGTNLPAATNATLVLPNMLPEQAGTYRVLVFNAAGSVVSSNAVLTLRIPAVITIQPQNVLTNLGGTAVFGVAAYSPSGSTLSYQWRSNGVAMTGCTNASLVLINIQLTYAAVYSVAVMDAIGPVFSNPATLTVAVPPVIMLNPLNQTVVEGGSVTLSVAVTNNAYLPVGYRWRLNSQYISNGTFVLNERTCFLTVTNVRAPYTNYAVVVTNAARPSGYISLVAALKILADSDGDRLPDDWELAYGLSQTNTLDATLDSDGDGMLNWQEYLAGTNPTNALSYLKTDGRLEAGTVKLSFEAVATKTYTIQYTETLDQNWQTLTNVVALDTNRFEIITDPNPGAMRYYRLVTPARP